MSFFLEQLLPLTSYKCNAILAVTDFSTTYKMVHSKRQAQEKETRIHAMKPSKFRIRKNVGAFIRAFYLLFTTAKKVKRKSLMKKYSRWLKMCCAVVAQGCGYYLVLLVSDPHRRNERKKKRYLKLSRHQRHLFLLCIFCICIVNCLELKFADKILPTFCNGKAGIGPSSC